MSEGKSSESVFDNETETPAILEFLAEALAAPSPPGDPGSATDSPFRTILFTDVVGSTPLLAQLKDAKMREVMRDHDAVLQAAVDKQVARPDTKDECTRDIAISCNTTSAIQTGIRFVTPSVALIVVSFLAMVLQAFTVCFAQ